MTDQLAADELDEQPTAPAATDAPAGADGGVEPGAGRTGRRARRRRINKWDRPPDPHDWRFFVGNLGKVLIATGLLLFGFVAYQLWGTGIETARAQNKLETQFEELLAQFDTAESVAADPTTDDGPDTAEIDDGDTAGDPVTVNDPAVRDPDDTDGGSELPDITADDIIVPVAVDLSDQAVEQKIPPIVRGEVLAKLEIPRIGRTDYVVPGVSLNDLKSGPGHYPDSPLPGQLGNASIAGHRTTYGAPFFNVDQLRAGDELITTMANGDRFVYEVTFVEVVSASDYWVVTTRDPNIAELTLTSCHPKYTARDRIVVHSVLNAAKSSNVGIPTFYELEPDPDEAPIPGDDPVLDAGGIEVSEPVSALGELDEPATAIDPVDVAEATSDADAGEPGAATDGSDGSESADPADDTESAAQADEVDAVDEQQAPADAFSQGWFDDRAAFEQIALWGAVLTIISLLAYRISRRFRHDSIGLMVGILPFLLALYFFYQNVNRLLPPGI